MAEEHVPCPGCAAPMGLDQEVCQACRRPRDEGEIEKGRAAVREREESRRRRPLVVLRWAAAAAALVFAFRHRDFVFRQASSIRASTQRRLEAIEEPPPSLETRAEPPASRGARAAAVRAASATASVPARNADPAPPRAAPARAAPVPLAVPPAAPDSPPPPVSRVYGVVYDIVSLEPVAGAALEFTYSESGPRARVLTDRKGRYQIDLLPPKAGLVSTSPLIVTARAAGYESGQIEDPDGDLAYRLRPLKTRLKVVAELSPGDLDGVPLDCSSEGLIPLDLVLVPDRASK